MNSLYHGIEGTSDGGSSSVSIASNIDYKSYYYRTTTELEKRKLDFLFTLFSFGKVSTQKSQTTIIAQTNKMQMIIKGNR